MFLSAAQLEELRREVEAAGRNAWNHATRTGSNVAARTTKELQALGARTLDLVQHQPKSGGAPPSKRAAPAKPPRGSTPATPVRPKPGSLRTILDPIQAGVEGATDAITFGLGDKYEAAQFAAMGLGEGQSWSDRYRSLRQMQEAEDAYAREHHPIARAVGGTLGTVGSIAMTGGVGAPVRAAPYVARLSGHVGRDLVAHVAPHVAIAGAGAAAGATGQLTSDLISRRPSASGAYADAAVGGALGATATRYAGPRAGAVVEAYASEGARGLRTGEASLETAQSNAILGAHLGKLGDAMGRQWVQGLSSHKKGRVGEAMSDVKTVASGQRPIDHQIEYPTSISHTRVDSITDAGLLIESKFGRSDLSPNQRDAQRRYENYRVDRWDKSHVGKATGGLSGLLFGQSFEDDDR